MRDFSGCENHFSGWMLAMSLRHLEHVCVRAYLICARTHKHTRARAHTHTQRQGQGATAGQADRCHPRCRRQHRRTSEVSPLRGVRERRGRRGSRHAVSPLLPQEVRILACPWQSRDGFFSTFEGTQRCGGEGKQGGQEKRDRGGGSKGGTIGRSSDQQRDL